MRTPRYSLVIVLLLSAVGAAALSLSHAQRVAASSSASFTIEQIKGYPFPNELTTAAHGERIAWAFNERGARNVWALMDPTSKPANSQTTTQTMARN